MVNVEDGSITSLYGMTGDTQPFVAGSFPYSFELRLAASQQALYVPGYFLGGSVRYLFRVHSDLTVDNIPFPPEIYDVNALAYDWVTDKLYMYTQLWTDIGEPNPSPFDYWDYKIYSIIGDPSNPPGSVSFNEYATFINLDQRFPVEIEYNTEDGYIILGQYENVLLGQLTGRGWTLYRVDGGDLEDRFATPDPIHDVLSKPLVTSGRPRYISPPPGDIQVASIPVNMEDVLTELIIDVVQTSLTTAQRNQLILYLSNAITDIGIGNYTNAIVELTSFQTEVDILFVGGDLKTGEYNHFMDWSEVIIKVSGRLI